MNDNDFSQERSEQATSKRRLDARELGVVPRSRELNTLFLLLVSIITLIFVFGNVSYVLSQIMEASFNVSRETMLSDNYNFNTLDSLIWQLFFSLLPFLLIIICTCLILPFLFGGWTMNISQILPKIERVNPMNGLKRLFSSEGIVEFVKTILKFLIIASLLAAGLYAYSNELTGLSASPFNLAVSNGMKIMMEILSIIFISLILLVLIDVPYQLWKYKQGLRMSKYDVKQELKDLQVSPEVRKQIRNRQYQILNKNA